MKKNVLFKELPLPAHFDPQKVGQVWRVPYQEIAHAARDWAREHNIPSAFTHRFRIALIGIDIQNTFCIPDFELYVAGRSGYGAVEDNVRLCEFIYRNLGRITHITVTLDTHQAMQIFHPIFLVDKNGEHPQPFTMISNKDIKQGRWKLNPALCDSMKCDPSYAQKYLDHYTRQLEEKNKYNLTIWPYHAMLGGIGHALVPSVEQAIFFHTVATYSQTFFEIKGDRPLTEHYSALGPEVLTGPEGEQIAQRNNRFIKLLEEYDVVIIAGQAKSHCVAWTIDDLLNDIMTQNEELAKKVYLLEDCTSPVVIPGVIDYTDEANKAFDRFAEAGMNIVRSNEPIDNWSGLQEKLAKY